MTKEKSSSLSDTNSEPVQQPVLTTQQMQLLQAHMQQARLFPMLLPKISPDKTGSSGTDEAVSANGESSNAPLPYILPQPAGFVPPPGPQPTPQQRRQELHRQQHTLSERRRRKELADALDALKSVVPQEEKIAELVEVNPNGKRRRGAPGGSSKQNLLESACEYLQRLLVTEAVLKRERDSLLETINASGSSKPLGCGSVVTLQAAANHDPDTLEKITPGIQSR